VFDRLVDQGDELELTEVLKAELDRRIRGLDSNPDLGIPWEKVKTRAIERIRR
jgi:putative addiction module component (TIGR02574 family)